FDKSRAERQAQLPFNCTCDACRFNYPILIDLPLGRNEIPAKIGNDIIKSYTLDRTAAQENYKFVVEFLQKHDDQMHCIQLATLFKYYTNIMNVIYAKDVSLAMRANPPSP